MSVRVVRWTPAAAQLRFAELKTAWGSRYPAAIALWENAWNEFVPFLDWDRQIRKIIYTTNAVESLNVHYRRAVRARGHFPNDDDALKYLYLVTRSLAPRRQR